MATTIYKHSFSQDGVDPQGEDILLADAVVIGTDDGEDFDVNTIPEETTKHSPPTMVVMVENDDVSSDAEENEPPDKGSSDQRENLDSDGENQIYTVSEGTLNSNGGWEKGPGRLLQEVFSDFLDSATRISV